MREMMIIQMVERTIPALKKGMGMMRGPTPNKRLTEVKRAEYFSCMGKAYEIYYDGINL